MTTPAAAVASDGSATPSPTRSVEAQVAAALQLVGETKSAEDFLSHLPLIIEGLERQLAKANSDYAHATEEFKKWNDLQNTPGMATETKNKFFVPMKTYWTTETERLRGETGTLRRDILNLVVLLNFQAKTPA